MHKPTVKAAHRRDALLPTPVYRHEQKGESQCRSAETRAELVRQLIGACQDVLGWDRHRIKVEFTQHSGDEMYHPHLNGFNRDWLSDESTH
jgi:membrane-bound lytic murein transglycosylase